MATDPKKSQRLSRVADLAHNDERAAARRLAEAQRLVDENREQLDELKSYQSSYTALVNQAAQNAAGDIGRLQNHRAFLTRLAAAIEAQAERIRQSEQQYSLRREEWLRERARAKALGKVVEQHRAAENRVAERRETAEQDERAQRLTSRWTND